MKLSSIKSTVEVSAYVSVCHVVALPTRQNVCNANENVEYNVRNPLENLICLPFKYETFLFFFLFRKNLVNVEAKQNCIMGNWVYVNRANLTKSKIPKEIFKNIIIKNENIEKRHNFYNDNPKMS